MKRILISYIYTLLTFLLLPIYIAYWLVKGILNKAYWDRIAQRFGWGYPLLNSDSIWIHAVSVGEVNAAIPLVTELKIRYPKKRIVITTVTPTGSEQVQKIFNNEVTHCYIPFETPYAVSSFFDAIKPSIALIMETEIWPNIYNECGRRKILLVLVSAKISQQSLYYYQKLLPLFRETLSHGILIAAQSERDAERFLSLGAAPEKTWIMGNIKFNVELPTDIQQSGQSFRFDTFQKRPIWIAASTHQDEEELILNAHKEILKVVSNMLLILVPRHPERFNKVKQLLKNKKYNFISRTEYRSLPENYEIFLGDTMGELLLFYAASDVAFVGGSMVPVGGHNILEPASLGLPIITGKHMFSQRDMVNLFIKNRAVDIVNNENELANKVILYIQNTQNRHKQSIKVKKVVSHRQGALDSLMARIDELLNEELT
tara:strand:- start:1890 stop:3179 length:1290 start_codon:yes stop_codon:yes gene_type:complete